jgi:hypothetical protein
LHKRLNVEIELWSVFGSEFGFRASVQWGFASIEGFLCLFSQLMLEDLKYFLPLWSPEPHLW